MIKKECTKCGSGCPYYQEIKANFSSRSFGFYCMHPEVVAGFIGLKVHEGDLCRNPILKSFQGVAF